ncbi:MAG: hypothetical protein K1X51_02455 [Rhodospirillaceae bacterium]|nr:hypothetical protein [Rhodospirillaceae bacterium]
MQKHFIAVVIALAVGSTGVLAASAPELVRDQTTLTVNGARETWQLVWAEPPKEVCGPAEVSSAATCPCSGFAYGEYGRLNLVRRHGGAVEILDLGPLFDGQETPSMTKPITGVAYLSRWPEAENDLARDNVDDPKLVADIRARPPVHHLSMEDYDRDGLAAEFLLQVGTVPCMKHKFVAVGVSKRDGRLHALRSAAHPERPLVLFGEVWDALRKGGGTVVTWECQDHGAEFHNETVVSVQDGIIHAKRQTFNCPTDGAARTLVEETEL